MSNAVYPSLPGLAWDRRRTPQWRTGIQTAVSGKETRAAYWQYPLYKWELTYEFLRADAVHAELQTLLGFFNARKGAFDDFLFLDPRDCSASGQALGVGNGSATGFPLARTLGGETEPVAAAVATPTVFLNGVETTAFTLSGNLLTFTSAPGSGVVITADFSFYWRVRFAEDTAEFSEFMYRLFECRTVLLQGVRI